MHLVFFAGRVGKNRHNTYFRAGSANTKQKEQGQPTGMTPAAALPQQKPTPKPAQHYYCMSTRRRSSAAETGHDKSTTRAPTTQQSSAEWHGRYYDNRRCLAALTALSHTCADRTKHLRLSLRLLLYIYENTPQHDSTTYSFVQRRKRTEGPSR